jgi:hypothetical protein
MNVEMFPEKEVIRYGDNVFIHKAPWISKDYPEGIFTVYLSVGVQHFKVGVECDALEDAEFTAKMLVKALDRLIETRTKV